MTVLAVHVAPDGALPAEGGFRVPRDRTAAAAVVPTGDLRRREEALAGLAANIRAAAPETLLFLTGGPADQVLLLRDLVRGGVALGGVRIVHGILSADRPFLPRARARWVHALVLDTPPTKHELEVWRRHVAAAAERRVVVAPTVPLDVPGTSRVVARERLGLPPDAFVVAQVAQRTSAWVALGIHAFAVWSNGWFATCSACGALCVHRLATERGRHVPRAGCVACGGADLVPAAAMPCARLVAATAEPLREDPRPEHVAAWLGVADRCHVPGDGVSHPCRDALAAADVALLLGDPAFADPLLAEAACVPVPRVVNDPRLGAAPGAVAVRGRQCGWDPFGHLTIRPTLRDVVRALSSACVTAPAEAPRDAERDDSAADWPSVLERLHALPRRASRGG